MEIHSSMSKGYFKEAELVGLVGREIFSEDGLREALNDLVRQNYLYYNPTRAEYKLQGKSMEIGLKRYVEEIAS